MKKLLIIGLVFLCSQAIISCCQSEKTLQTIPVEKELIYDFYSFNYRHSEWMSYHANYFFSIRDTAKLIVKENTELKLTGVFLHFINYKVNGVVINEVGNWSKRSFSITIALIFSVFFFLIYGFFKELKSLKAGKKLKEIDLETVKLFFKVYSIFTLFFCFVLILEGLEYGFVFINPVLFVIAFVIAVLSFSKLEKAKGSNLDFILSCIVFFLVLSIVIYFYSEFLFALKIFTIFLFDFALLIFISAFFRVRRVEQ